MTVDEYIERNPSVAKHDYDIVKGIFEDLAMVVWVSRLDRQKNRSIPLPIRGSFLYKELTLAEYDEQMIINSRFMKIYVPEKRKKTLKDAAEQWNV